MNEHIHFEVQGRVGLVTLDRPKALNALTVEMVYALSDQLVAWRDDDAIGAIVLRAVPGRAFCAGGDIRHVVDDVAREGVAAAIPFFGAEYRMNWRIKTYPKPYIALIDGIVMGGGVGISEHGQHRVFTENAMFAMPETGIGMFPDVGGSYFLSRLPHRLGHYFGLSGRRLRGSECISAGVGTAFVPQSRLAELEAELIAVTDDDYAGVIESFAAVPEPLDPALIEAGALFEPAPIAEMLERVSRADPDLAAEIEAKSPFAVAVTAAQLERGAVLDFAGCMAMEFEMVQRVITFPDFAEGVRALLVDKDKQPRWQHRHVRDVEPALIERCFEPVDPPLELHWQHDERPKAGG